MAQADEQPKGETMGEKASTPASRYLCRLWAALCESGRLSPRQEMGKVEAVRKRFQNKAERQGEQLATCSDVYKWIKNNIQKKENLEKNKISTMGRIRVIFISFLLELFGCRRRGRNETFGSLCIKTLNFIFLYAQRLCFPLLRRRTYSSALAMMAIFIIFTEISIRLDPLKVIMTSVAASKDLIEMVSAPFYPVTSRNNIAVVLIDENSLKDREIEWPLKYQDFSDTVRRILKFKPLSLYVGISYEKMKKNDPSFLSSKSDIEDALEVYKEDAGKNLNIFFSRITTSNNIFSDIHGVHSAISTWYGYGNAYPLVMESKPVSWEWSRDADEIFRRLHQEQASELPERGSSACFPGRRCLTPAMRLYLDYCRAPGKICGAGLQTVDQDGGLEPPPLNIRWGSWTHATSGTLWERLTPWESWPQAVTAHSKDGGETNDEVFIACNYARGDFLDNTFQAVRITYLKMLHQIQGKLNETYAVESAEARDKCPYHLTISEHDLNKEGVGDLLQDRIVLLGVDLPGISASVVSPVQGRLPAVYADAMALDNLLTFGDKYNHPQKAVEKLLYYVLALACTFYISYIFNFGVNSPFFISAIGSFIIILYSSFYFYLIYSIAPINWIGLFFILNLAALSLKKKLNN
jgi:hypothetical protein